MPLRPRGRAAAARVAGPRAGGPRPRRWPRSAPPGCGSGAPVPTLLPPDGRLPAELEQVVAPGRAARSCWAGRRRARRGPWWPGPCAGWTRGGPPPLLLAPSRRAADRVRDAVEQRSPGTGGDRVARTPHSLAWSVLREHALREGRRPPRLVTASERDEALAELLAGHAEDGAAPGLAGPPGAEPAGHAGLPRRAARDVRPPGRARRRRRRRCLRWPGATAGPSGRRPPRCCWSWRQVSGLREDEAHDPAGIVAVAAGLVADRLHGSGRLAGRAGRAPGGRRRPGPHARRLVVRARARGRRRATCASRATPTAAPSPSAAPSRACSSRCPGGSATPPPRSSPRARAAARARGGGAAGVRRPRPRDPRAAVRGSPGWSPAAARRTARRRPADGSGPGSVRGRQRGGGRSSLLVCMDRADEAAVVAAELRRRRHREHGPRAVVADGGPGPQRPRRRRAAPGPGRCRGPVRVPGRPGTPARGARGVGAAAGPRGRGRPRPAGPEALRAAGVRAGRRRRPRAVAAAGPARPGRGRRGRRARGVRRGGLAGCATRSARCSPGGPPCPRPATAFGGLPPAVVAPVVRVVDVLAAGAAGRARGVEEALWQVWDRLRVAERWRRTALRGGPDAVRAHADLDAAVALFDAAAAWVDRNPRGEVAGLRRATCARARSGDDRLGGDGPDDAVTVTTPPARSASGGTSSSCPACRTGCGPTPASAARCSASPTSSTSLRAAAGVPAPRGAGAPAAGGAPRPRRGAPAGPPARGARRAPPVPRRGVARRARARRHRRRRRDHPAQRPLRAGGPGRRRRAGHRPGTPERARGAPAVGYVDDGTTLVELTAALRRAAVGSRPAASGRREVPAPPGRRSGPAAGPPGRGRACAAPTPASGRGCPGRPAVERQVGRRGTSRPPRSRSSSRCPLQLVPHRPAAAPPPRQTAQGLGTLVHAALEQVPDADVPGLREVVENGLGRPRARGRLGLGAPARAGSSRCSRGCPRGPRSSGRPGTRWSAPRCRSCYEVDGVTVRGTIDRVERTPDGGPAGGRPQDRRAPWSRRPRWPRTRSSSSTSSPSGSGRSTASRGRPPGGCCCTSGTHRGRDARARAARARTRRRSRPSAPPSARSAPACGPARSSPGRPRDCSAAPCAASCPTTARAGAPRRPRRRPRRCPLARGRPGDRRVSAVLLEDVAQLERPSASPTAWARSSGRWSPPRWTAPSSWPGPGPARPRP